MSNWVEVDIESMFHEGRPIAGRIKSSQMLVREANVIDIQRQELPPDVWDKVDGKYVLKDVYRNTLIQRATEFMKSALDTPDVSFIRGLYLVSSIGTYFYSSTTDIDVKIVIDLDLLHQMKPNLKSISEDVLFEYLIDKMRDTEAMKSPIEGSERPMDWYVYEYAKFMDYRNRKAPRFDSIYDIINRKWYKFTPKIEGLPDTKIFEYAVDIARDMLQAIDMKIGKLKRYAIDYDYFRSYLKAINPNSIDVQKELDATIEKIEQLMESISADKSLYSDLREQVFDEERVVDHYAKIYNSVNFSDVNLLRKLLEHYGYWLTLVKLSSLWKDVKEKVTPEFIDDLSQLMKEI